MTIISVKQGIAYLDGPIGDPMTISGVVIDSITTEPIQNSFIKITRNGVQIGSGYTNSLGGYSITVTTSSSSTTTQASKSGYITEAQTTSSYSNKIVNFALDPYPFSYNYAYEPEYQMINLEKSFNYLYANEGVTKMGEGVTIVIFDTGINASDTIKYLPNGSLREMRYIDINYKGGGNYNLSNYEIYDFIIDSEDDWTPSPYTNGSASWNQFVGPFDGYNHGTGIVGIVIAIMPYANIIFIDCDDASGCSTSPIAAGFVYLKDNSQNNFDIISISADIFESDSNFTGHFEDYIALHNETLVFVAAGNFNYCPSECIQSFATNPRVFAMNSVISRENQSYAGNVSYLHSYSPFLFLSAPAQYITTINASILINEFMEIGGTSAAAPIGAASSGLLIQYYRIMTGNSPTRYQLTNFMMNGTDSGGQDTLPDDLNKVTSKSSSYGWGIIDIWEMLYRTYESTL